MANGLCRFSLPEQHLDGIIPINQGQLPIYISIRLCGPPRILQGLEHLFSKRTPLLQRIQVLPQLLKRGEPNHDPIAAASISPPKRRVMRDPPHRDLERRDTRSLARLANNPRPLDDSRAQVPPAREMLHGPALRVPPLSRVRVHASNSPREEPAARGRVRVDRDPVAAARGDEFFLNIPEQAVI